MKKIYSFTIILILIVSSCSTSSDVVSSNRVQKRKYTKGLHVKKTIFNGIKKTKHQNESLVSNNNQLINSKNQSFEFNKISKSITESKELNTSKSLIALNDPIDVEKPSNTINNSNVNLALVNNDKIQKKTQRLNKIINKKLSAVSLTEGGSEAKVDPLALTGFITSLVGLFVFPVLLGLLSIIFGAIGLSRINKNPEKYKGKGFGITALILGIIEVVVIFLLIALLLGAAI